MEFGVHVLGIGLQAGDAAAHQQVLDGSYSPSLVLASFGIAFFGSYVGLVISQQSQVARRGWAKALWITAGAVAMGGGIWSMHFVGMLAHSLPVRVGYDHAITAVSLIISIAASAIALFIICKPRAGRMSVLFGGILLGAGLGVMNYAGVAAMHGGIIIAYDPVLFGVSVVAAVILLWATLSARQKLDQPGKGELAKWTDIASAAIIGIAISGIHYASMSSVTFYLCEACDLQKHTSNNIETFGANAFVFLVIAALLALTIIRRNVIDAGLLRAIIKHSVDGLVLTDRYGKVTLFNPEAEKIFGYAASEVVGQNVAMLMPESMREWHDRKMAGYDPSSGDRIMNVDRQLSGIKKSGEEFPIEIDVSRVQVGRDVIFSARIRDVTEQRKTETSIKWANEELERGIAQQKKLNEELEHSVASMDLMNAVATTANQTTDVDEAFSWCLEQICRFAGWEVGHVYKCDKEGSDTLFSSGIWYSADGAQVTSLIDVTERTPIEPGVGLAGHVCKYKEANWIRDIAEFASGNNYPCARSAKDCGLSGLAVFPVIVRDDVVAVIEFFSAKPLDANPELFKILTHVCAQMGRVMERVDSEARTRANADELVRSLVKQKELNEELERSMGSMDMMSAIATVANQSANVDEVFSHSLERVCAFTGWDVGHVYRVEELNGCPRLHPTSCWYCTDEEKFKPFREHTESMVFEPTEGLLSRVYKQAEPVWMPDIETDHKFIRAREALYVGLTAAVAFPIMIRDDVVAVIEFYATQPINPTPNLTGILNRVCSQTSRAIERANAEKELTAKARELEQSLAKEKELNEMQRQFICMASHEFRTPLAIIDSAAQRLERHMDKMGPEEVEDSVSGVRSSVRRLTTLMEKLLSEEKMEAGQLGVNVAECDPRSVIMDICIRQLEITSENSITYDLKGLPETIMADSGSLDHIFTNLMSNAVKYSPGAADIHVRGWREGDDIFVSFRDRGVGMDEDDVSKLFSRFFRAKTSNGIVGTGIGLNFIKKLTEAHGGTISVESKVGAGSTFTVRLPITGPGEAEERKEAA